ncbi:lateral flagellar capping protein LafB [Aeromonas veronii]|uniref:lateral flagellar capping protein LafB n=1 Tax=Aeromonas veronii TaxID=654 RepID=UPI0021DA7701|nr:lateral flagellar capping protein LafB [Aeromonas veronii]UYB71321.1 lateral flagellar capping protein LafB [Aeromonas veronii]
MQVDPASAAMQMVTNERKNMDKLLKGQLATVKAQQSSLSSINSKLSSFQTLLKDLNKPATLQAQKASLSQEGIMTVTSNGKATPGQYNFQVKQLAQAHQFGVQLTDEKALLPTSGKVSFTVDGKAFAIDLATLPAESTAQSLVSAINDAADNPGVKASLVRTDGKVNLVLTSKESGAAKVFTPTYDGDPASAFGKAFIAGKVITPGQDSIIKMGVGDGALEIKSPTNKIENVVEGLTLDLTRVQKPTDGPMQVTVTYDNEAVTGSLKKFVDSYNELLELLNKETSTDIKAKGVLASDATVRGLKGTLANAVRNLPAGMTLTQLGIKTEKSGKLVFSDSDFKKSLEKDPELLGKALMGDDGLLKRMSKVLDPFSKTNGVMATRKSTLEANQKRLDDKMESLNKRMESVYKRYLNQFTTMNQMMQTMGAL